MRDDQGSLLTFPDEFDVRIAALVEDTPAVVVHLPTLTQNIRHMAALSNDAHVALRPHTKTHKTVEIAKMQLEAGARGIQVAKTSEAMVMANAGIGDILVGYPVVGSSKLQRLVDLATRVKTSVALDSLEVAAGISRAIAGIARIDVLLEIDTGLNRLGVLPGPEAVRLAHQIADLPGLDLTGLLTHEGHVYVAARDAQDAERLTTEACRAVVDTAEACRSEGLSVGTVSVGSSATARYAMRVPGVTEVRPGTYVFNDLTQVQVGAASAETVAAFIVTTVVSRPSADRAVIDAGTKALTSDQLIVRDPTKGFGFVVGHPDWSIIRASEEHGVISCPMRDGPMIGDRLLLVPNHICPVINLFDELIVVDDDQVVDHWPVAGRGCVR